MRLALVLVLLPLSPMNAEEEAKPRPSFRAVRAEKAPVIDGDFSDAVWPVEPEITGFTQRDPNEGQPATHQTRLKSRTRTRPSISQRSWRGRSRLFWPAATAI